MSVINNRLKTWLKRNGFRGEGHAGNRKPMRESNGYVVRSNRRFRIRDEVVDVGEPLDTFDRWANSTERTIPLEEFKSEFKRGASK